MAPCFCPSSAPGRFPHATSTTFSTTITHQQECLARAPPRRHPSSAHLRLSRSFPHSRHRRPSSAVVLLRRCPFPAHVRTPTTRLRVRLHSLCCPDGNKCRQPLSLYPLRCLSSRWLCGPFQRLVGTGIQLVSVARWLRGEDVHCHASLLDRPAGSAWAAVVAPGLSKWTNCLPSRQPGYLQCLFEHNYTFFVLL